MAGLDPATRGVPAELLQWPVSPHLAGSPGIAASFHSAVFSLLKANNPWPLGTSCCVPTARRPLSLLYLDRDGNVVKTDVPDMVVEACGCS